MDNRVVRVTNGLSAFEDDSFVGLTVQDLFDDTFVENQLGLNGDETVTVTRNGASVVQSTRYVLQAGDVVRFDRSAGTKG